MEIEAPKIFILAYEKSRDYYDFLREYKNLGLRFEEITLSDLEKKDTDQSSDILVVFSQDPGWLDTTLTNLRKRFTTSLSLILAISSANYENENRLADDVLTFPTESKLIEEKIQSCISMTLKIGSLTGILDSLDEDRKRAVTLLRFIYTRNKMELKPKPNKLSPTNYYYPPANIFLNTNPGEEIEKLETLEKMGMLSGEVVDRVYLCPSCLTASIRLRELCPSCDSIEIEKIVAMRHEYCSYTGDEEDFKKPQLGIYVCPKCKEEISPDEVKKSKFPAFLCQFCGNIFKEPEKKFTCSSCKNDYSYEHLLIKDIKSYSITAEGIKAAEDGILYDFSEREAIFEGEKALLKDQVFKEIFYLEMARSTRYKRPFCLARVRVVDFENIVNIRGEEKAKRISEELFSLMYKNLRRTDVLTTIEPGIFLILFLETPVDGTESALRKIKKEVDKVFGEAIKISWEVIYESKEREREKDLQKDLQSVNSNIMASGRIDSSRLLLKNIGIKSVFKYFITSYIIIYCLFLFIGGVVYLASKTTGLLSPETNISQISLLFDNWHLSFLNYFGPGIPALFSSIIMGFLGSLAWGLLGILVAWIANIMLRISGGIELRFESLSSKYSKYPKNYKKPEKEKRVERRQMA